ncbi:hypothetical protein ABGB12_10335 [Actinocorallia sp. B10E7]|uniref:hypothetical protein n=1 Tax=Actinocorallia sp. B10E7 TaxID=3153558 RepID=UPI00325F93FA
MSWKPPMPLGYVESIQAVGGFAAPLLAGGSFTMAVLALQSSASPSAAVSRWPDAALALFVAAGLMQIGTVQATAWTRRYMCTPGDLLQWFPGEQTDGEPSPFLRGMQESHMRQAHRWANIARGFYHAGVLALLTGLLVACVPPGALSGPRWAVLAVCGAGVAGELAWLVRAVFLERRLRRDAWSDLAILLAVLTAMIVPGVWDGWPARLWSAAALVLCLLPVALRRSVTPAVSLLAGAVGLLLQAPRPVVAAVLAPALVLALFALTDLLRRQRALGT